MNSVQENSVLGKANTLNDLNTNQSSSTAIDWGRWVFIAVMVVLLIGLGYRTIYSVAWNDIERTDYTVYRAAGQAVIDQTNIYEAHNVRGWLYVYPPPFAILMIPFAKLSLVWGSGLWYLLSIFCLAQATVMSVRLANEALPAGAKSIDLWTLYEVPLLLASPWLVSGLMRCQASGYMVWLMIASIYLYCRGRPVLGGMSLAAAALIKAFPIALLAYFVWQRQWRFIGACFFFLVLGGLLLPSLVYGWHQTLEYWSQWFHIVAGPALSSNESRESNLLYAQLLDSQKPRNQSLEALLLSLHVPSQLTKPILALMAVGMFSVMAWLATRANAKTHILILSAFVMWNLLIPPISETHYFGLMLLPLAVLTATYLAGTDSFSRRMSAGVLVLCFIFTLWVNIDKPMELYRLLCWASLGIWFCLLLLAHRQTLAESRHTQ
jgi:hypothetical protein